MVKELRPVLCVVAGPNGSGKTSTTEKLLANEWTADSVYINPDNIAQENFGDWNSLDAVMKAAKEATRLRYDCLERKISFVFETVFSLLENLYHIQKLVLNEIAMKGVALEVLLTSNTAISFYRESKEHHLEKWLGDDLDEEGMLTPPIVVGSDDPGIFMTNIYIEYARIATYLEQKGYGYMERMHILEDLIKNGEYFKFGG